MERERCVVSMGVAATVRTTAPLEVMRMFSGVRWSGAEDAHGVGVAASGGDDEVDSGLLGGGDGGEGAWRNLGFFISERVPSMSTAIRRMRGAAFLGGAAARLGDAVTSVAGSLSMQRF